MTTLPRILSIASLLVAWLMLASLFPPTIVPGPVPVFKAMARNISSGQAFYHLYKTLLRVGFGLILTMLLGVGTGTIMGLSRKGEIFLDSWVMVGLTVPAIVYSIICLLVVRSERDRRNRRHRHRGISRRQHQHMARHQRHGHATGQHGPGISPQ